MTTIQITIDEELLSQVDELARQQGLDRSALMDESLRRTVRGTKTRRLQEEPVAAYVALPHVAEMTWRHPVDQDVLSPDLVMRLEYHFPGKNLNEIVAGLLLEHRERELIQFRRMAEQFEEKYAASFDAFHARILDSEPDEAIEQDYFDWEMAVTAADDLIIEVEQLRQRQQQS